MAKIGTVVFDISNVLIRWDPRNLYRQMGYSDADTAAILQETGLPEINHYQLDAGAPFAPTLAALASLLLRDTVLGRHIYAVGSNEETARLCGGLVAIATRLAG